MPAYSFLDVQAAIVGPGGSFNLGSGSGAAEEGITITYKEDKNIQHTGADGKVMNSLNASRSGSVVVRLLKTSPVNAQLSLMYNIQAQASSAWGLNIISIRNNVSGDSITCTDVAFKKWPDITYDKDGKHNEWAFDAKLESSLGGGIIANLATFTGNAI